MRREEGILHTKKALSESLKKFMQKKALNKITVSELIADCDINRNTFYYHFSDIYDLLQWTLKQEILNDVHTLDLLNAPEETIRYIIKYIQNNAIILNCIYDSVGRDELKRLFQEDFLDPTRVLITECEIKYDLTLKKSFYNFICDFITESIAGSIINGFKEKKEIDEEELVENLTTLLNALPDLLKKAPQK